MNLLKGRTCESCAHSIWYKDNDHMKFCYGNPQFQTIHFKEDGWFPICGYIDGGYAEHIPIPEIGTCLEYDEFKAYFKS